MANEWDLNNVDVWRSESKFDMSKWKNPGKAKIKLMSVPWDAQYEHIVDWKSEADRDQWFHDQDGYVWEDETGWNFKSLEVWKAGLGKHEGSISVDLPYEAGLNYNYLFVELFEQPVPGGEGNRREVYFYFLTSLNKVAPSTTKLFLELDTWTTYRNSVDISGLNLHRGHYFHTKASADDFLADPLANHYGITDLEPDLPSLKSKVSHTQLISYSKNSPRICIATTGDFEDKRSWFTTVRKTEADNPDNRTLNFPSTTASGKQAAPWNPSFNKARGDYDSYDSTHLKSSVKQYENGTGNPESLNVYSMTPSEFSSFIAYARQNVAQILDSIKAVYVLDSTIVEETPGFTQWGYSFKKVTQSSSPKLLESIGLNKAMFGYNAEARDFAKLYTQQFATIEVSNGQGSKAEIAVEEIAKTLSFYSRASSLFPFLKLEALIDGVGGSGVKSYAVKPLNSVDAKIFGSDWERVAFDLEVPVYSIYIDKVQEVAQKQLIARNQEARKAAAAKVMADDQTRRSWARELQAWQIELYSIDAQLNRDKIVETRNIDLAYGNTTVAIDAEEAMSKAVINKDYSNETRRIAAYELSSEADYSKNRSNAKRSANTERSNTEQSAAAESTMGSNTVETANVNEKASLNLPYSLWFETEREANRLLVRDTITNMMNKFDGVWEQNNELYEWSKEISRTSEAMGVMTSGKLALYGALGSGISSIPAADLGASIATKGNGGITKAGMGAIAGVTALNTIETALKAVAINDAIWENQLAQSLMTHGEGSTYAEVTAPGRDPITYFGPGLKYLEIVTALNVDSIGQQFEYDSINLQYERDVLVRDNAETVSRSVGYINADRALATESINLALGLETAELIALRTFNSSIANIDADFATSTANLGRSVSKDEAIQAANRATALSNVDMSVDYKETIRDATKETAEANLFTTIDRYGWGVFHHTGDVKSNMIDDTLSTGQLQNAVDYGLKRSDWTAEFLTAVQGPASSFGQNAGKAEVDAWGTRGLTLTVKRCSDAIAAQAAGLFSRFGYTAGNLWIENPELSLMTGFTYWKADGLWLTGNRINETNKEIIKKIFERGTTVWNSPAVIFSIKLSENTIA